MRFHEEGRRRETIEVGLPGFAGHRDPSSFMPLMSIMVKYFCRTNF